MLQDTERTNLVSVVGWNPLATALQSSRGHHECITRHSSMKRRCLWSKRWKKVMLQLSMSRILISSTILMIIHSGPLCLRDQL
ncbi:hypothetical protein VIGAN_08027000 [Vigna angularis var. angularis]|uniref:Uncharacterized protein n=1 Tax=Vigna angularis var. angularis TaxID=157739 RepID=A0A0S3SLL2_PHAAN|nr:hypothetical protein VIGAN_08027000 [Vigna angularis var. angularis]